MTSLPDPGFGNDPGVADPKVRQAMDAYRAGVLEHSDLVTVLRGTRVLVAVVAVLDEATPDDQVGSDGLPAEKDSHMAAVSMINPDGRRGLLAFTGVDSLGHWDDAARPVPISFESALAAARDEGADALILDVTTRLVAIPVDALK